MIRPARACLAFVVAAACATPPESGEFGTFRLAGRVRGVAPLNLLPPVSDRSGNVYVLYGGRGVPQTAVFAGKNGGGWSSGCTLTKGDSFGVHGWVGYDSDRHWYWSGDALVSVSGQSGDCHRVIDRDPGTDANILFRAVMPWVRDAPSRRTLVAMVQSPVDLLPFSARVDLEAEIFTNIQPFEPASAIGLKVLGVGAKSGEGEGVVLLQYTADGSLRSEARFYDTDANSTGTVGLGLPQLPSEHLIRGFLQVAESGLVAGLFDDGNVVTFDKRGGRVAPASGMKPVGIHKWEGKLFVVGTTDGRPVFARIDDGGGIGGPQIWTSSERAAASLSGPIDVRDDRELPSTKTIFPNPRTAMGEFPFLHEHALNEYATGTTLWLVAGPSFDTGGQNVTAFAMAPVGVSYP